LSLTTEDSIKPVTCNGPPKAPVSRPFLSPPFGGWNSIISYLDHDLPNFERDGLMIAGTGLAVRSDGVHVATDFPAYWSQRVRQYVYYDGHNGYDFNLWYQPVYAAAPGKVIFAGWEYPGLPDHGYGQMVMIDHHNGYVTLYGHFSKLKVHAGERVKRLQLLGISGNTGHSSGPHLHFTVFHNCTPTDPYGWTGPGPDPLAGYEGETSRYLWLVPPLVSNPLPGLAAISQLSAPPVPRLLLLRLPSAAGGTSSFFSALRRELSRATSALMHWHGVSVDTLHAALRITAPVTAARLYAVPDVASIATPDAASDARADVLAALARAALVSRHKRLQLGKSRTWSGYLLQWQGRTFLVGQGPKAQKVKLRLSRSIGGSTSRSLQADPSTGAYAVDLGRLSRHELALLRQELNPRPRRPAVSVNIQPVSHATTHTVRARRSGFDFVPLLATGLLLLALVAISIRYRPHLRAKRG
jgi:murein DD-endopeptidase MepM/ murein hydrolase activator NlpD